MNKEYLTRLAKRYQVTGKRLGNGSEPKSLCRYLAFDYITTAMLIHDGLDGVIDLKVLVVDGRKPFEGYLAFKEERLRLMEHMFKAIERGL